MILDPLSALDCFESERFSFLPVEQIFTSDLVSLTIILHFNDVKFWKEIPGIVLKAECKSADVLITMHRVDRTKW